MPLVACPAPALALLLLLARIGELLWLLLLLGGSGLFRRLRLRLLQLPLLLVRLLLCRQGHRLLLRLLRRLLRRLLLLLLLAQLLLLLFLLRWRLGRVPLPQRLQSARTQGDLCAWL